MRDLKGLLFLACLQAPLLWGQNPLLRELAKEDQSARLGEQITDKSARTDFDRIKLVLAEIGKGAVKTPRDKFYAALVLQHTPMKYCGKTLGSFSPDNYLLAHHLFLSAFKSGLKDAGYLSACAIDRYLSSTEGHQKYGTNRITNQESGKEELVPIDRKTTDLERAKYGVPPLSTLLSQFPEQGVSNVPKP